MDGREINGLLEFLRAAEGLKTTTRSGYTSAGEAESVAEHTWRLCLMALVLHPSFPEVDFARLVKICIIHDLGEVIRGDSPAPEQALLAGVKADDERRDLQRRSTSWRRSSSTRRGRIRPTSITDSTSTTAGSTPPIRS